MSISAKRNKRKGYKDNIIRVPIVSYINTFGTLII